MRLGRTETGLSNLGKDYKAQEQRAIDRMTQFRAERDERRKAVDKRIGGVETGLSNLGADYKRQEQEAIDRMAKFRAERDERSKAVDKSLATTYGGVIGLQKSLADIKARQDTPKQTVASLPSNYKSTEAKAFAKAKSYQDSKAKGQAATKATGIPSGSNL